MIFPVTFDLPPPVYNSPPSIELKVEQETLIRLTWKWEIVEATGYTNSFEECGKTDGITTSGTIVQEYRTVAVPPHIPFGTIVYIPSMRHLPNKGYFVAEDRGGAITRGHIDIYMEKISDAIKFGRRNIEIYYKEK